MLDAVGRACYKYSPGGGVGGVGGGVGRARYKSSPVRVLAELVTSMDSPGGGGGWQNLLQV